MNEATIAKIRNHASTQCRRLGISCIDDIAQEAYLQVLKDARNFDPTRCGSYSGESGYQRFLVTRGVYAIKKAIAREVKYRNTYRSLDESQ